MKCNETVTVDVAAGGANFQQLQCLSWKQTHFHVSTCFFSSLFHSKQFYRCCRPVWHTMSCTLCFHPCWNTAISGSHDRRTGLSFDLWQQLKFVTCGWMLLQKKWLLSILPVFRTNKQTKHTLETSWTNFVFICFSLFNVQERIMSSFLETSTQTLVRKSSSDTED